MREAVSLYLESLEIDCFGYRNRADNANPFQLINKFDIKPVGIYFLFQTNKAFYCYLLEMFL